MVDKLNQFVGCKILFLTYHSLDQNFLRSVLFLGLFLAPYRVLFLLGLHMAIRFDSMWEG